MRRSSPKRFRVVAESEFFQGSELEWTGSARALRDGRWSARAAVAATLAISAGVVVGVVAANFAPGLSASRRLRSTALQAVRVTSAASTRWHRTVVRVEPSALADIDTSMLARSARPSLPARVGRARSHPTPSRGQRRGDSARPLLRSAAVAVATERAPVASAIARPAIAVAYATARPHITRAEFGFER